jgi:hypothetical protein
VGEAAMKESYIVEKIASVMDNHGQRHVSSIEETRELPSSEETRELKVMADLKGSECLSVEECLFIAAVFQDYDGWKQRLVGEAATKGSYIVEKIASVMDKHVSSIEETRELCPFK